ncbi:hypothetical protein IQ03_00441 [Gemmobacter caeni]|uniref:Secreted protein n=2 Tax=Paracoccaceae TaxID=31989 RepID=A0A2T6BBS7_9RHOB|nr:hypothetical protein C8N34_101443 [Gemmobacter caeni]TWJ05636.1 hypothetical protein IQ03_00441 [Gemmobacter caeni]
MMRDALKAACGLWLAFAVAGQAQTAADRPVVVELYTSQGCSSCPPADDLLATLAADPAVIPLALHVDYWDYIGWEDHLAQPGFTARQKAYARAVRSRTIYTPQMIVNGGTRVEGNDPEAVLEAIRSARGAGSPVTLEVQHEGGQIRVRAQSAEGPGLPMKIQLVRYRPEETVNIERGENAGRTVTYRNIVTDWQPVAEWPGQPPLDLTLPLAGDEPAVVLIQRAGPAEILAAQRVN